jgi:hypothetical protein
VAVPARGALVALTRRMSAQAACHAGEVQRDGFGTRRIEQDPQAGRVEVLQLTAALSRPAAEQGIRARAARFTHGKAPALAAVHRIGRGGNSLIVTTAIPEGVTLADLLGALEFGTVSLPDDAVLELAGATIRAVAAVHEMPGGVVHGALTPAHVILSSDGGLLLTGAVFADALQALQINRERLWREFAIALPASAGLPRFDQRTDVTQLGAIVLAILLRRTLGAGDYPRGLFDLVNIAASGAAGSAARASSLRMWLQQALQLHAKATFGSAVDASRAFGEIIGDVTARRTGSPAFQPAIRKLCGHTDAAPPAPPRPAPKPVPPAITAAPPRMVEPQIASARPFGFLRNVLRAT